MKAGLKRALLRAGRRLSPRHMVLLDATVSFLALGRWLDRHRFAPQPVVATREELFELAASRLGPGRLLYLEFGVFEGASMRWWSQRLAGREATLVGFDSFAGLPEEWNEANPKGHFATGGQVPGIDDERVRFEVGWIEDTLPAFEAPEHDQLVVNVDVDVYSSARTVLHELRPLLVPGTLLYFDELAEREHEMKAFEELLQDTGWRFEVVGTTATLTQWLFHRVG